MEGRHGSCVADFDLKRVVGGWCACKELGIARISSTDLPGARVLWAGWDADDIDTKGTALTALCDSEKFVGFLASAGTPAIGAAIELSEDCGFDDSNCLVLTGPADDSIPSCGISLASGG